MCYMTVNYIFIDMEPSEYYRHTIEDIFVIPTIFLALNPITDRTYDVIIALYKESISSFLYIYIYNTSINSWFKMLIFY